jgi:hypothetical protein
MNVADLIEELKCMPQDAEVHFQYNYGDHWRTQVAPTVDSVEMGFVQYSDYHRMNKVVEGSYDEEDELADTEGKAVVLIG